MGRLACGRNRIACCRTAGVGRASIHIRYHAVFIRFYRVGVDGVALGGVGQDAERQVYRMQLGSSAPQRTLSMSVSKITCISVIL